MSVNESSSSSWSPARLAALVVGSVLAVLVMLDAWTDIALIAMKDEESSQVLLAPAVFLWLMWVRRDAVRGRQPRNSYWGPALLTAGIALSAWGYQSNIQSIWHLGAVVVLAGVWLTVVGPRVFGAILPALGVLVFLIPVPGRVRAPVADQLQVVSAQATQSVMQVFGVFVERAGNLLVYNGQDIAVAEACNGMRMIFALVLVCYAFAFGTPLRGWVRGLILVISPVAAVAANIIRLVPTVLVYGHFDASVAQPFHDVAGWAMLAAGFIGLMALVRVLRWADLPVMADETSTVRTNMKSLHSSGGPRLA